jgi:RHS repeat-associated protein
MEKTVSKPSSAGVGGYIAALCAAAGVACAVWALYLELSFIIHGSHGTQEYLIGAIGTLLFGLVPSAVAGLLALVLRNALQRRSICLLVCPLIMNVVLWLSIVIVDRITYS